MKSIADLRKEYQLKSLSESDTQDDPILQFDLWWKEAIESGIEEVNAMTLATAGLDAKPTSRIVLLKGYNEQGFVFFTNYESKKGRNLNSNPYASLTFYWKELERQVRIEGHVVKTSDSESDEYFHSRPLISQLGACASPQSSVIESRDFLENRFNELSAEYEHKEIPRPMHWGGYVVNPVEIEFWQGRAGRLHDRILYSINEQKKWSKIRLAP
jgi:pyridoxamine 5'-phosphate oxidase